MTFSSPGGGRLSKAWAVIFSVRRRGVSVVSSRFISIILWFHKDKIDGCDETESCSCMVPVELFVLKDEVSYDSKYHKGYAFLNDFQLHKVEGASIVYKADTIGWNLAAVLKKGNHPRESDDQIKGPVGRDARLLET